jgi:hypothetical protein
MKVRQGDPTESLKYRAKNVKGEIDPRYGERVENERIRPREKGYGIHEVCEGKTGEGSGEDNDEDSIFDLSKVRLRLQVSTDLLVKEETVEEIDGSSHGTRISTKETANNKASSQDNKRP